MHKARPLSAMWPTEDTGKAMRPAKLMACVPAPEAPEPMLDAFSIEQWFKTAPRILLKMGELLEECANATPDTSELDSLRAENESLTKQLAKAKAQIQALIDL